MPLTLLLDLLKIGFLVESFWDWSSDSFLVSSWTDSITLFKVLLGVFTVRVLFLFRLDLGDLNPFILSGEFMFLGLDCFIMPHSSNNYLPFLFYKGVKHMQNTFRFSRLSLALLYFLSLICFKFSNLVSFAHNLMTCSLAKLSIIGIFLILFRISIMSKSEMIWSIFTWMSLGKIVLSLYFYEM
jgi:hypothetical protein